MGSLVRHKVLANEAGITANLDPNLSYKLGLVRTLVDRIYKISNTWLGFHEDIKKLTMILRKNCFPIWVIDKIIHSYVSKKMNVNPANARTGPLISDGTSTHFYKLPRGGHWGLRYCGIELFFMRYFGNLNHNVRYRGVI